MKNYDFVIVGSGCAGLAAALELTLAGKKTLLIEKHNIPGGCASGFVRGRFEFDPSLHELCSVGSEENPSSVRQLMSKYGVNVKWNQVEDCFRVISEYSDGTPMDVTMPSGKDAFIDKMEYYVPGSRNVMENLFEIFQQIEDGLAYLGSGDMDGKVIMDKYSNLLKAGSYPCKKVFDALGLSPKAQDILSTYWSYLGVDTEGLSFLHYASMVNSYIRDSAYIPTHTSHEISVKMLERFRELGGEAWFNCRAEKFIFENGKCVGVDTTMGKVFCDCVLANINPDIIYGKMMPRDLIPDREKKLVAARNRNMGARMFTCYFGLDKTAEQLGIKDYSIFMSSTSDSVKQYKLSERIETNKYGIFLCYNIANPEFSPEGTCVCSFTTFYSSPIDWEYIKDEDYARLKNKIAKSFIELLKEKTGIDISGAIEECTVATPLTFSRYLGVPEGSVYGYETRGWDGIIARTMNMNMGKGEYPIDGLIPIGTSGIRGDGYSSGYLGGQIMADFAMKKYSQGGNE